MTNMENTKKDFASMSEVVMKKDDLIKALVENKAKHDALFEIAEAGYWESAKEALSKKKTELENAILEFKEEASTRFDRFSAKIEKKEILPNNFGTSHFNWSAAINLVYPENQTSSYDKAIRMMQASIYDEVKLSDQEFNCYVLNDWSWKSKFTSSVSNYINSNMIFSGCYSPIGPSGYSLGTGVFYNDAKNITYASAREGKINF